MGMLKNAAERVKFWYFSYTILSNVYFLEPVERLACNILLMFFLALVFYTTCVYLPGHYIMMLHFFKFLLDVQLVFARKMIRNGRRKP